VGLLLAVDIGTGSCRCVLYDPDLNRLGEAAQQYATRYPQPGWAEQDPQTVFSAVVQTIAGAISQSGRNPRDVTALTLDGPLHSCLGLAADKRPATPVLTWEDSRAHAVTRENRQAGIGPEVIVKALYHAQAQQQYIPWISLRKTNSGLL